MPCTAQELIRTAEKEIGIREDPPGSNHIKYNAAYYSQDVSGSSYAWCAVFVWWCFKQAGAAELYYDGKKTAYVPTLDYWGRQAGLTVTDPQPGDLIIYDWNHNGSGQHVGICVGSNASTITTIEGNANDQVAKKVRQRSDVLRIIRPKYDSSGAACSPETCPILARLKSLIK